MAAAGISGCGPQLSVTKHYTVPVSSLIVNGAVGSVSVSSDPGNGVSVTATFRNRTGRPSITHAISGMSPLPTLRVPWSLSMTLGRSR